MNADIYAYLKTHPYELFVIFIMKTAPQCLIPDIHCAIEYLVLSCLMVDLIIPGD